MIGRAGGRLRALGVVVALAGLVGGLAACEPPGPRVYVYGDSMAWEARDLIREWGVRQGYDVVVRQRYGGAPCTFFQQMRDDRRSGKVHSVIFVFTGNTAYMEPCVASDTAASHARQLRKAAGIWSGSGARLVWAATPRIPGALGEQVQDAMRAEAQRLGMRTADAGRWVSPNRVAVRTQPCLSGEPCVGRQLDRSVPAGHNIVRSNDRVHFCPGGARGFNPCPHHNSGAMRFARALAETLPRR